MTTRTQLAAEPAARTDFHANSWQQKRCPLPEFLPTHETERWFA